MATHVHVRAYILESGRHYGWKTYLVLRRGLPQTGSRQSKSVHSERSVPTHNCRERRDLTVMMQHMPACMRRHMSLHGLYACPLTLLRAHCMLR